MWANVTFSSAAKVETVDSRDDMMSLIFSVSC